MILHYHDLLLRFYFSRVLLVLISIIGSELNFHLQCAFPGRKPKANTFLALIMLKTKSPKACLFPRLTNH